MKCLIAATLAFASLLASPPVRAQSGGSASPPSTAPAKSAKTVRLLTIGNSFSRNATRHLDGLVRAAGHALVHHQAAIGGATMARHWETVEHHRRDPQDPRGYYSTKLSLEQELKGEPWDYVTIQQASIFSHDVATYRPHAERLRDFVALHAPGAELLIHQTWAYRRDDPRFAADSARSTQKNVAERDAAAAKPGPKSEREMYDGLTSAYQTIAAELGLRRIPVGDAFIAVDEDPTWGYRVDTKFDLQAARPPQVPDQTHSLHVGRRWVKQKDGQFALAMDGHHANTAGEYLGSCVFFEMLFGAGDQSCVGNPYLPAGMEPKFGRFLQETAHRAVVAAKRPTGNQTKSAAAPVH